MQYQKKVALNMTMLHFRLQLTGSRCKCVFLASHFVKSEFSEVIKMCNIVAIALCYLQIKMPYCNT